jgi:O-antigen ligase
MIDTSAAPWWDSRVVTYLEKICALIVLIVALGLAWEENLSWVGWAIAGVLIVLTTMSRWPVGAFLVLCVMSALPYYFVQIFGWKARPEHFASAVVALAIGIAWVAGRLKLRLDSLDYWVLAYVAINFFSSTFGSPAPASTLRWALQSGLAILPYFLIRAMIPDAKTMRQCFWILVAVGVAESSYGLFCYAMYLLFGSTLGIAVGQYGDVSTTFGSHFEPNLFGAYAACCAILLAVLYVNGGKYRLRILVGLLIASAAAICSFSRAALAGLIIVAAWVLWTARPADRKTGGSKLTILAIGMGVVLILGATAAGGILEKRFEDAFTQGWAEDTAIMRYVAIVEALKDIPQHPLIGTGTSSLQLTFDFGQYIPEWAGDATWVGNLAVRVTHDTGFIGLGILIGFYIALWRKVRRQLHQKSDLTAMLLGLWSGFLLYAITFQSTDGSTLAFTWIHVGLLASSAIVVSRQVCELTGSAPA